METTVKTYVVRAFGAFGEYITAFDVSPADPKTAEISHTKGGRSWKTGLSVGESRKFQHATLSADGTLLTISVESDASYGTPAAERQEMTLSYLLHTPNLDQIDVEHAVFIARKASICDERGAACGSFRV
jgi:hypothetical protein